jgi:hypothetical protein
VSFVGGAFITTFDANFRVDSPTLGVGTKFNLRDDLGVDRQQTGVWVGAEWRFKSRQRLGINYTRFTPSATKTLTRSFQIGDAVYPAGASLTSELHMEIIPITYSANAHYPLPLLGVRYRHDFSQRWSINMEGAGIVLKVAEGTFDVRGSAWNARVEAEYRFARHFAAAAAVDAFSIDLNANKTAWGGDIGYRIWGPQVYLKARF